MVLSYGRTWRQMGWAGLRRSNRTHLVHEWHAQRPPRGHPLLPAAASSCFPLPRPHTHLVPPHLVHGPRLHRLALLLVPLPLQGTECNGVQDIHGVQQGECAAGAKPCAFMTNTRARAGELGPCPACCTLFPPCLVQDCIKLPPLSPLLPSNANSCLPALAGWSPHSPCQSPAPNLGLPASSLRFPAVLPL